LNLLGVGKNYILKKKPVKEIKMAGLNLMTAKQFKAILSLESPEILTYMLDLSKVNCYHPDQTLVIKFSDIDWINRIEREPASFGRFFIPRNEQSTTYYYPIEQVIAYSLETMETKKKDHSSPVRWSEIGQSVSKLVRISTSRMSSGSTDEIHTYPLYSQQQCEVSKITCEDAVSDSYRTWLEHFGKNVVQKTQTSIIRSTTQTTVQYKFVTENIGRSMLGKSITHVMHHEINSNPAVIASRYEVMSD